MKSFHCMSHLPEVFASRDREKAYYIAGVLVIRGPSYAKFFCLNRVSKFKGPRKSVLHSGRPSYPVYHLSRVYCTTPNRPYVPFKLVVYQRGVGEGGAYHC